MDPTDPVVIGGATAAGATVGSLTVLYDAECALCRRCREWMESQATYVPVRFMPATSDAAVARLGDLPWLGADLIVLGDHGEVWVGPAAFLVCLWATVEQRAWSYRLSARGSAPLAERFFHTVSANRRRIGSMVGTPECPDGRCGHRVEEPGPAAPPNWVPPGSPAAPALRAQPPPPPPPPARWLMSRPQNPETAYPDLRWTERR